MTRGRRSGRQVGDRRVGDRLHDLKIRLPLARVIKGNLLLLSVVIGGESVTHSNGRRISGSCRPTAYRLPPTPADPNRLPRTPQPPTHNQRKEPNHDLRGLRNRTPARTRPMPTLLPTIHNCGPEPLRTNPMSGGRTSRAKGRRWQTAVRQWLETHGHVVHERPAGMDGDDVSLYANGLAISVECKDQQRIDLAGWLDQAVAQAPPRSIAVVVAHRKGRAAVDDAYAVMRCADLIRLLEGNTP